MEEVPGYDSVFSTFQGRRVHVFGRLIDETESVRGSFENHRDEPVEITLGVNLPSRTFGSFDTRCYVESNLDDGYRADKSQMWRNVSKPIKIEPNKRVPIHIHLAYFGESSDQGEMIVSVKGTDFEKVYPLFLKF